MKISFHIIQLQLKPTFHLLVVATFSHLLDLFKFELVGQIQVEWISMVIFYTFKRYYLTFIQLDHLVAVHPLISNV